MKAFLKETITTDSDTGETAVVSDYVAQKTQETLETLAAVDARFKELGGELTDAQITTADSYAQQMMDNYGDTYTPTALAWRPSRPSNACSWSTPLCWASSTARTARPRWPTTS